MAKVYLDTNIFIDAVHRKPERNILNSLEGHIMYISPLSVHIYCYIFKIRIPNQLVIEQQEIFSCIDISNDIVEKALLGPTQDFDDNVQLHSCAKENCDFFLTTDKSLLKMKFFGKTRIVSAL